MEWGGWKQFGFEGMLLLKTCLKLGLQKPVLGLQAFKSGEAACKSYALPTQETTTHTYHRTLKDTGQRGPPRDSLGQEVVNRGMLLSVVTRELTLMPGWGVFAMITAQRGFRVNHWTPLSAVTSSTPF